MFGKPSQQESDHDEVKSAEQEDHRHGQRHPANARGDRNLSRFRPDDGPLGHRSRLISRDASVPALASGGERNTYWRLNDTVTVCIAHGRVIFLDVAKDRYSALPRNDEPSFIRWLLTPGTPSPQSCHDSLIALGIADPALLGKLRPVACEVVMPLPLDPDPAPPIRVSPTLLFGVARSLLPAWSAVRSHRLQRALAQASKRMRGDQGPRDPIEDRLAEFRAARPLIPVPRVCLHDCLALVDWLGPNSGVQLVLGVSPYPFSAHCWVQAGDRVIDDHPQCPSRFHPILHLS